WRVASARFCPAAHLLYRQGWEGVGDRHRRQAGHLGRGYGQNPRRAGGGEAPGRAVNRLRPAAVVLGYNPKAALKSVTRTLLNGLRPARNARGLDAGMSQLARASRTLPLPLQRVTARPLSLR